MSNNNLQNLPRFTNNRSLEELMIEAENNKIENIDAFAEEAKLFEKLLILKLKINHNKLCKIQSFNSK